MKTIARLLPLSLLVLGAATFAARADEPPSTPPAPATPPPASGDQPAPKWNPGQMRERRLKMLAEKLSLTPAEKQQVKAILEQAETQGQAIRQDTSLSRQDRIAKRMALMKSTHDQIRALLTPAQQAIYDTLPQDGGRGGHRGPPPNGEAPANNPPPPSQ